MEYQQIVVYTVVSLPQKFPRNSLLPVQSRFPGSVLRTRYRQSTTSNDKRFISASNESGNGFPCPRDNEHPSGCLPLVGPSRKNFRWKVAVGLVLDNLRRYKPIDQYRFCHLFLKGIRGRKSIFIGELRLIKLNSNLRYSCSCVFSIFQCGGCLFESP